MEKLYQILYSDYGFYILLFLCLVLSRLRYIGNYFRICNTLIHEFSHAIVALLTSGEVLSVKLFSDKSGLTVTKSKGKFGQMLIALSGYIFSSAFAFFAIFMIFNDKSLLFLIVFASIMLINLLFFVRNTFGIVWLIINILIIALSIYFDESMMYMILSIFYATMLFSEALSSTFVVLNLSFRSKEIAGDSTNLWRLTGIRPWLWSILFVAQALFFVFISLKYFPIINVFLCKHQILC